MKRVISFVAMCVIVPAVAGAQTVKVTPPVAPVPVVTPNPKVLPTVVVPELADLYQFDAQELKARAMAAAEQAQALSANREAITEATRKAIEDAQRQIENLRATKFERPFIYDMSVKTNFDFDQQFATNFSSDSERSFYDRGMSALSQKQYEQAIMRFDQAIALKGTKADGAMYWKAFAQYKLGRGSDANATLNELQKQFKDTKYGKDIKALEAEIKRSAGQPVRPENEDDEDLKLLAIQSLQNSDPERAIPLLEGVLNSAGSLRLKDRALFVLAMSNQPQAHAILVNIAKGGNPDLQLKAIRYLAQSSRSGRNATSNQELMDIYNSAQNDDVKRAVLQAFGSSGDRTAIMSLMGGTQVLDLRREGINQLGNAQAGPELWSMYQKEENKQLRMQILSALGNMGAYDKIIEVAKTEKDDDIRRRAISSLGNMRAERSGAALSEIYGSLSNVDDKKAVIRSLSNQNNAEAMIAIYRKESNFEIKKQIVSSLGNMPKNEAAKAFLLEILKYRFKCSNVQRFQSSRATLERLNH
jgi:HEAT repeat protein